ncbi:Competence protein ComEC [Candidatus Electronema halotolerans]
MLILSQVYFYCIKFTDSGSPPAALRWCERNLLLPVTACFLLGIIAGKLHPLLAEPATVLALLLIAALALVLRSKQAALFLSLPLFFLTGHLHVRHQLNAPQAVGQLASLIHEQTQVTLVGTLAGMVETGTKQTEQGKELISRFVLETEEVRLGQHWQPVRGRVRLSLPGRADDLRPGATLMLLAKIGPPHRFKTPGAFNYPVYLAAENIYLSGWISERQDVLPINDQSKSGWQRLRWFPERIRQQIGLFLSQQLRPELAGVYEALLIGSRAKVAPELLEQFKATGTMHILAISGLHVGLLALLAATLLRWLLGRSRWLLLHSHLPSLALLGTLPLLFTYALIAGMNTPVLRAVVMAAILLAAALLRRQHNLLHLLAAAALLVLASNPLTLFTASFQLSFSAVAALILFLPQILPPDSEEKKGIIARWLVPLFMASIAATLGTLPLMLFHFHRISLISPLLNLLIEPLLCFWALPWGLAAIPCIFISPPLAIVLLKIGSLGLAAGQWCVGQGAALPWASVWTIRPSSWEILAYFLLLLLWTLHRRKTALLGAALLVLHFTWGLWLPERPGRSQVTILDIGQGSSAFLHLPDGTRILADGGSTAAKIGEQVIGPYLWSQRIWRLDQAVISHPHSDHFSGMDFILCHFRPKQLWINGDAHREGNYQQILDQAAGQGIRVLIPENKQRLAQGKDFALTVLHGAAPGGDVNDASLVLRYQHGQRAFLLPGDIGKRSEQLLIQKNEDLQADMLLAAHHGSSTSNSEAFLAAVRPELIVVSAGTGYRQEHFPAATNLALWQERHIAVWITREQGAAQCATDGRVLECGRAQPAF